MLARFNPTNSKYFKCVGSFSAYTLNGVVYPHGIIDADESVLEAIERELPGSIQRAVGEAEGEKEIAIPPGDVIAKLESSDPTLEELTNLVEKTDDAEVIAAVAKKLPRAPRKLSR